MSVYLPRISYINPKFFWSYLPSLIIAVLIFVTHPQIAKAAFCDPPITNPVACENTQVGTPQSVWDVIGAGDSNIQGFATNISYNLGETAIFKINTPALLYHLDIYRMGYYQGNGARLIATVTPSAVLPQTQPVCLTDVLTGLTDCGNWTNSASWQIPATAVSGVYFAKLTRDDGTAGTSHIVFVVRDDSSHSDLLFQTSDTTWQAYNTYGGNSFYQGSPAGRAYKISYNRPFISRGYGNGTRGWVFNSEYPMIRFLEQNGYNTSYSTGTDTDRRGSLLLNHKAFLSVGHDEYWSGNQRTNVVNARDNRVNLAFFSGNEMFWKTRWENSYDGNNTPYRTLVSYKETHANARIDPQDPPTWTGSWRDPRFSPPSDGGRPENAVSGTMFQVNGPRDDAIQIPGTFAPLRFWRNTSVAALTASGSATMPVGTLGNEWDQVADNGFSPAGLVKMSATTLPVNGQYLLDYGTNYGNGTATHNLTLYKAPSGALVFGAGTMQWSWGLDFHHDNGSINVTDPNMQQATINLFADMGVQPSTLMAGMVAATQTTDVTPSTSVITSPASGASIPSGTVVTISGTASDTGGVVGGVEVSTDNGTTWHPANGTSSWSYVWNVPNVGGNTTFKSRAVDDSGNLETPGAGVNITVTGPAPTPTPAPTAIPYTLWLNSTVPTYISISDPSAIELGVKFRSAVNGFISGLRFYKSTSNTGTHIGSLWSSTGLLLGQATYTSETASGWQQVNLATPAAVLANTTYVASYHTNTGYYSADRPYFTTAWINNPLIALQDGTDGGNGVYKYNTTSTFPNQTYGSSNYWVDLVFNTTGPSPTPTPTPTPLPTATPTPTPTVTPTPTPTPTPAPTPTPPPTGSITVQVNSSSDDVNETNSLFDPTSPTFWFGGCGTTFCNTGLRFNNLSIPKGAVITSAYVSFYNPQQSWIVTQANIYAENIGSSLTFSSNNKPSQRALTANYVYHNDNVKWLAATWYNLDNITPVVQEVVNRADWQAGNSLTIIIQGTNPTSWGRKYVTSFDGSATFAPKLVITYQ